MTPRMELDHRIRRILPIPHRHPMLVQLRDPILDELVHHEPARLPRHRKRLLPTPLVRPPQRRTRKPLLLRRRLRIHTRPQKRLHPLEIARRSLIPNRPHAASRNTKGARHRHPPLGHVYKPHPAPGRTEKSSAPILALRAAASSVPPRLRPTLELADHPHKLLKRHRLKPAVLAQPPCAGPQRTQRTLLDQLAFAARQGWGVQTASRTTGTIGP